METHREGKLKNVFEEVMAIFFILMKNYKLTDSRSSVNPKENKREKTMLRHIVITLLRTTGKEKALRHLMGSEKRKVHLL